MGWGVTSSQPSKVDARSLYAAAHIISSSSLHESIVHRGDPCLNSPFYSLTQKFPAEVTYLLNIDYFDVPSSR